MRYVQVFIYGVTALAALTTGFRAMRAWRTMEDELDWRTAGKTPWERMFRNVAKEYQARDRELPRLHKRWSLWTVVLVILLVSEVFAFQR